MSSGQRGFAQRLRGAEIWYYLAQVLVPVAVCAVELPFMALGQWTMVMRIVATVIIAIALGSVVCAVNRRKHPATWPVAAMTVGAVAGVAGVTGFIALATEYDYPTFLAVAGTVGCLVVGLVLPAWLADRARSALLEPIPIELADSGLEVPFWIDDDPNRLELRVGVHEVALIGHYAARHGRKRRFRTTRPLGSLTVVEQTTLATEDWHQFGGTVTRPVKVSAGPALRIRFGTAQWIVPTNQGPALIKLLERRAELARADLASTEDTGA